MPESLPLWRAALAGALHRGRGQHETRYLQLATLGLDGVPRNRSVVFRGFGPDSELLVLSDARSRKMAELARQALAEVCWYLPVTREQFRLQVKVDCHGTGADGNWQALRRRLWQERGPQGQAEWLGFVPEGSQAEPPPCFVLLSAAVLSAEHLQLRPNPHAEVRYSKVGSRWISQPVTRPSHGPSDPDLFPGA